MKKRDKRDVHGWVVLDKPVGMTSTHAVAVVKRLFAAKRAGHAGTLDPLASGCLPIALGEATKTVPFVMDGRKLYRFTVRWGQERDTDDADGRATASSAARPQRGEIEARLPEFTGTISQVPPQFSAIKVAGERAYDLARRDEAPDLRPRTVTIHALELIARPDPDHAEFRAVSGKGAYMRSLARDIARALGTVGHVAALRRTAVGPFDESRAISLAMLESLGHSAPLSGHLLPVETVLDDIPALALTETEARKLSHGQAIPVLPVASRSPFKNIGQGDVVRAMAEGRLVALATIMGGEIRPFRVINL
ncbi:MAG TPA: tRNA pseudouridine(55) synthase TruB [Rhodospirillales bacterium]